MLTHAQIWAAIDALAERQGISASSLARRAGLDPTTFNRSKRINTAGQARWPSTESIAKILTATSVSIDEFLGLMKTAETRPLVTVPFRALGTLKPGNFDAAGLAAGEGWDAIPFPGSAIENCFALEVHGDAYAPTYRDGDVLVASAAVARRRGDRVVILSEGEGVILGNLGRETSSQVQVTGLQPGETRQDGSQDARMQDAKMQESRMQEARMQEVKMIATRDIRLIARIIWASQ